MKVQLFKLELPGAARLVALAVLFLVLIFGFGLEAKASKAQVKLIKPGETLQLGKGVKLGADGKGPFVVFGDYRKFRPRNWIDLSQSITLWQNGVQTKLDLLGMQRGVGKHAFAIRMVSKHAQKPQFSQKEIKGKYSWNYNHPTSFRDRMTAKTISKKPLFFIGSSSGTRNPNYLIVTNYGIAEIPKNKLKPKAIYFKLDSGKKIVCPINKYLTGYDVPEYARGNGIIGSPVNGSSRAQVNVGLASVSFEHKFPGVCDLVSLKINENKTFDGPMILDYVFPDFAAASRGMATYVDQSSSSIARKYVFQKPDQDFSGNWEIKLEPPIKEEFGLGPNGLAIGTAHTVCTIWKYGDLLLGTGGYRYSDCGLYKGGTISGETSSSKLNLEMKGSLNLSLQSTGKNEEGYYKGVANIESRGRVTKRSFVLVPAKNLYRYRVKKSTLRQKISKIPEGKSYWNAITVYPGVGGRGSIVNKTLKLAQAEAKYGEYSREVSRATGELAHLQYYQWLSARNFWGANHFVTLACKDVVAACYKKLLEGYSEPSLGSLKIYKKYLEMVGRHKDALALEKKFEVTERLKRRQSNR